MSDTDALSNASFGNSSYLRDFPVKIRVLTLDPIIHTDKFGNTRYAFIVWNQDLDMPQILDKGPGFAQRFKEIHQDADFGGNLRNIDLKITTNGKSGMETRYTITPIGTPAPLEAHKLKAAGEISLSEKIENGIRLSEYNNGTKVPVNDQAPLTVNDTVAEVTGDEEINLDDIPF